MLPLLFLSSPPLPSAPDTRDLFKLCCCKCNKPGPVPLLPLLTRAGICVSPTLSKPMLKLDRMVGRKYLSHSLFPLGA